MPFAAPEPPPAGRWLLHTGVTAATSAAILGLAVLDGGSGPIGRLGWAGQLALVGGAVLLPPLALVQVADREPASYLPALGGGLLGLGLGFAATRRVGGDAPGPADFAWRVGGAALGQGLGATLGYELYRQHRLTGAMPEGPPDSGLEEPQPDWLRRRPQQDYKRL